MKGFAQALKKSLKTHVLENSLKIEKNYVISLKSPRMFCRSLRIFVEVPWIEITFLERKCAKRWLKAVHKYSWWSWKCFRMILEFPLFQLPSEPCLNEGRYCAFSWCYWGKDNLERNYSILWKVLDFFLKNSEWTMHILVEWLSMHTTLGIRSLVYVHFLRK